LAIACFVFRVPQQVWNDLGNIRDDDAAVKQYGVTLTVNMAKRLMEAGENYKHTLMSHCGGMTVLSQGRQAFIFTR
jgi:hypothetical protein